MGIESMFSEADLTRIRQAVAEAEQGSSGEIVPYLVGRIDDYPEVRWRAATLGALSLALVCGALYPLVTPWAIPAVVWITLPTLLGAGIGWALGAVPRLTRLLATDPTIEGRVQLRAQAAFLSEEVFATRDRTGILLFVSVFEQRAVILADSGIHQQVPAGTWDAVMDEMVAAIRSGRAVDGVCDAIARCGKVLVDHRVERRSDDTDELHNGLRIQER